MENKKEEKEKRIKKEMLKIKKIYKTLSKNKLNKITELIYRASFFLVIAQDMEEELKKCNGYTVETINASQSFIKPNPLLKEYRDTIKSYQAVIKQLEDLTKDEDLLSPVKDELDEFLDK